VPRQHSSGGKQTLLGISKRGDSYLRTLLIHGARAVLRVAERKAQHADSWLAGVMGRRNHSVFQDSCRVKLFYAARSGSGAGSSGFSITVPIGVQFRVFPLHLAGCCAFAA
ncbi:transposase, partial [Aeromonas cavernicola]|uniref:transposase n=1 Tax=Aeromonas cavernicola TaxID=1006623 RepID=UPI003B82F4CD